MADYTTQVSPKKVQEAVQQGRKRFANFRSARLMFLRNYVGQYYDRQQGTIGDEPLNLIFNAIRVLVPNIVLSFPKHTVETQYLVAKQYAELLSLSLDLHSKQINVADVYRRVIVDAIFTLGVMKTGLAQSDSIYALDEMDRIDAGSIYTEAVDFDRFIGDPNSKEHLFRDARFLGDIITVPRRTLLESGYYKNDLIERLPRCDDHQEARAASLSKRNLNSDTYSLEDEVEVAEIWVPSANAIITVPATDEISFDDYLRVDDYYGVNEGPYTLLALTPPVPGNPLPVPAVGIWNDLHVRANRMATKIMDQAERQKDVIGYKRSAADDAEEARNAKDGDAIAMDDPDGVRVHSFGGQKNSNEQHLQQLQGWFNMMAGNPDQVGGSGINSGGAGATGAMLLQQNASIGLEDMKDLVYKAAAEEGRKRAWYKHTDPMLHDVLMKRQQMPAQFAMGPMGPIMVAPPMMQDVQVVLTPEARAGEFIDFNFSIEPESMGRKDSRTRFAQALDFCTKIMPAVFGAATAAMQLGLPFSAKALMLRMAKDAGITWLDEVFHDPEFQMQMMQQMAMGPNVQQSKGQVGGVGQPPSDSGSMMDQVAQNGQLASAPFNPSAQTQDRQSFQAGANAGQRELQNY